MALSVTEVEAALVEGDEGVRQGAIARLDRAAPGALAVLLRAMADTSWRVRREAVERAVMGEIPTATLVAAIVPLLGEPDDVGLRNAAIEAIVTIGLPAVEAMQAALAGAPEHRKVLCDVLGRIGAPTSATPLAAFMSDPDWNVRIAAAEAIGRLAALPPGQPVVEVTRTLLDTLLPLVGATAGDAAAFLGTALLDAIARRRIELPPGHLAALLPDLVLGAAALRALAAGAVAPMGDVRTQARNAAVARLGDTNRARREAAILAVAALIDNVRITLNPAARAATTEALLEGTVEVQRAAARVLGAAGDASAARALLVAIDDPALEEAATDALELLARRDVDALAAVINGLQPSGRVAIYRALARGDEAEGGLRGLYDPLRRDASGEGEPSDEMLSIAALDALGARGGADAAPLLAAALEAAERLGSDGYDRAAAARTALSRLATRYAAAVAAVVRAQPGPSFIHLLGEVGGAEDALALAEAMSSPEVDVRRAAATALATLVERRVTLSVEASATASEAARVALLDESPGVRASAALALSRLERGRARATTIDALLHAARDEDARVRGAATRALVELAQASDDEHVGVIASGLRTLADGTDALTSVPALEALLTRNDPADDVRLLDALTGVDEERRKVALYALGARPQLLLRGELMRLVERALHDARWDLRRAAVAALVSVGDVARPALVARRAVESDAIVRGDLDRALDRRGDGGPSRG